MADMTVILLVVALVALISFPFIFLILEFFTTNWLILLLLIIILGGFGFALYLIKSRGDNVAKTRYADVP